MCVFLFLVSSRGNSVFVVCIAPDTQRLSNLSSPLSSVLSLLNDSPMALFFPPNSIREERIWLRARSPSLDRISQPQPWEIKGLFSIRNCNYSPPRELEPRHSNSSALYRSSRDRIRGMYIHAGAGAYFRETRGSYPSSNFQQRPNLCCPLKCPGNIPFPLRITFVPLHSVVPSPPYACTRTFRCLCVLFFLLSLSLSLSHSLSLLPFFTRPFSLSLSRTFSSCFLNSFLSFFFISVCNTVANN